MTRIKSIVPGSGVYSVKGIAFVLDNFTSTSNPHGANVEVELAALDEVEKLAAWTKELSDASQKTHSIASLLKNSPETHSSIAELAEVMTKSVAASVLDEVAVAQPAGQAEN